MKNEYLVKVGQLDSIEAALDVLTMVYHACLYDEETGKGVSPGVVASSVLMAYCTISDIVSGIREATR